MKHITGIIILASVIVFASCNDREKEEKKADIKLSEINTLIKENKLNEAKAAIDSFHIEYARLVNKRKEAVILMDSVTLRESYRTVTYCNNLIPELVEKLKSLEGNFVYQKNEKYDEVGRFVHKSLTNEQNNNKTYLKCEIDENNDIFLTSNYCGAKINHHSLKLQAGGQSVTATDGTFYSFNEEQKTYEQLTFKNEEDGGIIQFIKDNKNMPIKVSLEGDKSYTYELSKTYKDAIADSYLFFMAKKSIKQAEKDLKSAQQRIEKIQLLYNQQK